MNEVQRETWRQLHEVWTRGDALRARQRWDEAALALDQALELAMTTGDRLTIAMLGFQLAQVRLTLEQLEGALEAIHQSLEAARLGSLEGLEPWILLLQGDIARQGGSLPLAVRCWQGAEGAFRDLGRQVGLAIVLKRQAEISARRVSTESARVQLERSVQLARLENQVGLEASGWRALARLQLSALQLQPGNSVPVSRKEFLEPIAGQDRLEALLPAFRFLALARGASQSIGDAQALGREQLLRVESFWRLGDLWRADQCLKQAMSALKDSGDTLGQQEVEHWRRRLTWWRVLKAWLMLWLDQWLGRSVPTLPPGAQ